MDPIAIATITSAVSVLGSEYAKGVVSEAGKSTWTALKELFGWTDEPEPAALPHQTATALAASPALVQKVLALLKSQPDAGAASAMVGHIQAEKVVNVQTMYGNITL